MKTFRNALLAVIAAMSMALVGCSTSRLTAEEKALKNERQAEFVLQSIADNNFVIEVDQFTPRRGASHNLSYGYSLTVKGDTVISYLPYFGQAISLPYGGGKGLNFEATNANIQYTRNAKGKYYRVVIEVTNEEDTYLYVMEIFDNGKTSFEVRSRRRDAINFTGQMAMPLELL